MGLVLILEPEEVNAARIRTILESVDKNFEYELVESAESALDVLEQRKPDVFIGDMEVPFMSAAELFSTVEMLSPETVRVVMTDGRQINETVAFMIECRIFKIINKPCRVADDLLTPIQAAIRYKRILERIIHENKEAEKGKDSTEREYLDRKENWMGLVAQHKRSTSVILDILASNLELDDTIPEKISDRVKRWYQWMVEEYVAQVLEGEGDYESTLRLMNSFCHDPAHNCTFQMWKKTPDDIEPECMKEITYILRLVTAACKDMMSNWNIHVVLGSAEKVYILRVRFLMEGTSFRIRNEELRAELIRATKLGIEAFGCKVVLIPKEQDVTLNIALPRRNLHNF